MYNLTKVDQLDEMKSTICLRVLRTHSKLVPTPRGLPWFLMPFIKERGKPRGGGCGRVSVVASLSIGGEDSRTNKLMVGEKVEGPGNEVKGIMQLRMSQRKKTRAQLIIRWRGYKCQITNCSCGRTKYPARELHCGSYLQTQSRFSAGVSLSVFKRYLYKMAYNQYIDRRFLFLEFYILCLISFWINPVDSHEKKNKKCTVKWLSLGQRSIYSTQFPYLLNRYSR